MTKPVPNKLCNGMYVMWPPSVSAEYISTGHPPFLMPSLFDKRSIPYALAVALLLVCGTSRLHEYNMIKVELSMIPFLCPVFIAISPDVN